MFDTAFHATLPEVASMYAVPQRWRDEFGIRRFGFHGLSVQWAAERVVVPRLVVCHLGGGCSVTAVRDGVSVDTTMGFSPLEGVPMATRSGSLDVEIVLHLLRTGTLGLEEIDHVLEHESGLLGVSGISGRVEELERLDEPRARLALELFSTRVAAAVAALTVALGGLDALVFTAGVGEGSIRVREDVCDRLRFLGVELDAEANAAPGLDRDIAAHDSRFASSCFARAKTWSPRGRRASSSGSIRPRASRRCRRHAATRRPRPRCAAGRRDARARRRRSSTAPGR